MSMSNRCWGISKWEQTKCENCGRMRVNLCNNGYHVCEKCDWSPELKRRIADEEFELTQVTFAGRCFVFGLRQRCKW
jgi:hypothetical protein